LRQTLCNREFPNPEKREGRKDVQMIKETIIAFEVRYLGMSDMEKDHNPKKRRKDRTNEKSESKLEDTTSSRRCHPTKGRSSFGHTQTNSFASRIKQDRKWILKSKT
jgi:hypothetical protein